MYRTLRSQDRQAIDAAISSLEQAGVLRVAGQRVLASEALRRLERLRLVAI